MLGLLTASSARAQTNAASDSRYLLIFDTSSAMKRRAENIQRIAGELVYSGMNGQMRSGDTLGVWTFNESLSAGGIPLMRWAPERRVSLASRITEHLRTLKFENQSRPQVIMPALQRVVTNSVRLTVLVFSSGLVRLEGTPFDDAINASYEPFRDIQQRERMPFVTVLRVKDRAYLGYAVTPSPWAVEFPKFPPDPVVAASKPEPKPATVRPTVPPLIVIGKKDTNAAPTAELPQPGTEAKPALKPGMTEAEKLFARLAAEQGIELPAHYSSNAAAPPTVTEAPKTGPPTANVTTAAPPSIEPKSAAVTPSVPSVEPKPSPAVQATVVPIDKHSGSLLLLAAATSVLVVAIGVVFALMRRRHRSHVSLITSSMDRGRK